MTSKSRHVTQVDKRDFLAALRDATVEKDVEAAYRQIFQKYYGGKFAAVHETDGYLEPDRDSLLANEKNALRLLLEVKWQKNFNDGDRIKLIAQAIYYLKKFEQAGEMLPNVLVGGDENEMFTIYAPKLYQYLDEKYDWSIAPSSAYENEALLRKLEEDENIRDIFIYLIDKEFDIDNVFNDINALCEIGEFRKLKINEANLRKAFDEFIRLVFGGDNWLVGARKIGATDSVSIFIKSILGYNDIYIHPNKPNILVNGQQQIRVDGAAYHAFFSRYDRKYTKKEIDTITAIADRLIEELERRFKGDFWTPTIWADEAMKMMESDLGGDFREKYIVWDPAAGTKNLTRDYTFKNLFSSTIHQSEINMSEQYNKGATSFQYDFLNDDIDVNPGSDPRDLKMPKKLFEALKADKPIVFYTNPPYGQASNQNIQNKKGIAENKIGKIMRQDGFGHASSELYTQFIFRVQKIVSDFHLKNAFFFFFNNKGFLTSPAFGKFTDQLLNQFKFNDGFMLNAGEFQGTSSNWGIIFSNFEHKKESGKRQNSFEFCIKQTNENGKIEVLLEHTLSRVEKEETITTWLTEEVIHKKVTKEMPRVNGGLILPNGEQKPVRVNDDFLGFMEFHGYGIQNSDKYVHLNSTSSNDFGHGYVIYPDNFEKTCVTFAIRKSILPIASWYNDKDIFRRPSDEFQNSKDWPEFVHDCVVYSLFHKSSYQTSLRDFEYDGKLYDVPNEWFFMSNKEILQLAEYNKLNDISFDARNFNDRFVYRYLHNDSGRKINLSNEARELLLAGEDFIRACFPKRYVTNLSHPEWHLMTWDAGYYQSYKIYTENKNDTRISEAYKKLEETRTRLETKIRRHVYADGILKK